MKAVEIKFRGKFKAGSTADPTDVYCELHLVYDRRPQVDLTAITLGEYMEQNALSFKNMDGLTRFQTIRTWKFHCGDQVLDSGTSPLQEQVNNAKAIKYISTTVPLNHYVEWIANSPTGGSGEFATGRLYLLAFGTGSTSTAYVTGQFNARLHYLDIQS
jgi:hypothetical protein